MIVTKIFATKKHKNGRKLEMLFHYTRANNDTPHYAHFVHFGRKKTNKTGIKRLHMRDKEKDIA